MQKKGHFRQDDDAQIDQMLHAVKTGECDWTQWKDWLVMGQYEDGKLAEIVVAKVVRTESA